MADTGSRQWLSCWHFVGLTILLSVVPKLFYVPLHSTVHLDSISCNNTSILEHSRELYAKSTAIHREQYAKLFEEIAVIKEAVSTVGARYEEVLRAEASQAKERNMLSNLQEKLKTVQAKQNEIKEHADEVLVNSINIASKNEERFQNITDHVVAERDTLKSKLAELKLLENRVQAIGQLASGILNSSVTINAKYKEQSVRIKDVEETVSEILDETESLTTPVSCPDPPSLRPIQAVDNSTVYLIIDSIIKNLTLEKEEKKKSSQKQRAEHSPATRRNTVPSLDFALRSAGSKIVSEMTSVSYFHPILRVDEQIKRYIQSWGPPYDVLTRVVPPVSGRSFIDFFHLENLLNLGTPDDAISLDTSVGQCWPLQGSCGNFTVQLFRPVEVASISIDHISRQGAANIQSAPRHFEVYAALATLDGTTEPELISTGEYDVNGEDNVQNFRVGEGIRGIYNMVTLKILDNYGHENYTCVYRFRVHDE